MEIFLNEQVTQNKNQIELKFKFRWKLCKQVNELISF